MPQALPARPDLHWLKKRAKETLARLRAGGKPARLAAAQLSVARDYGFTSWRRLKAHVDSARKSGSSDNLFDAVRRGDVAMVDAMLEEQPRLAGERTVDGETLLHLAVHQGDPKLVDLLIDRGVDPSIRYGRSAHTPLSWAVVIGSFAAAKALIRRGIKPDLFCAAGLGALAIVKSSFDRSGKLKPNASQTGSTRYAPDGSVLPCPPQAAVEVISDAMYMAARHGHLKVVRWLLQRGGDVKFRAFAGGTSLHWAHFSGSFLVVQELLRAGADPTARDDWFNATPREFGIIVPSNWGLEKVVDCQLRHDRSLANLRTPRGTPLHEAARGGHVQVLVALLKAGADPQARDDEGKTAFDRAKDANHVAAMQLLEHSETLKQLIAAPAKARNLAWKPIMDAAFAGDAAKVKKLIAAGADPNVVSKTAHRYRPLHRAIEHKKTLPKTEGHEAAVRALLEGGADPKLRGTYNQMDALTLAASSETRFVPILLGYFGELDLFHACIVLDESRVRRLLGGDRAGAKARDSNGWSPLHYCAASAMFKDSPDSTAAQLRIARLLIQQGADPSATYDFDGKWPIPVLYHACGQHDNPALAAMLMDAGATPFDNESVYHAADEGHERCLALFEERCDRRALANECTKVLPTLMWWGRSRAARWLLAHGADPNSLNPNSGDSALHAAVRRGMNEGVIELLLRHGGDPEKTNREGKSAIAMARSGRKSRILKQLQVAIKLNGRS